MHYTLELEIEQPRDVVGELLASHEHLPAWQPGLIEVKAGDGEEGAEGSTARLRYRMGKSVLEMKETVVERRLPERYVTTYETDKVWNRVVNEFEEAGEGRTLWRFQSEFKFSGFLKFMALLFPGTFRKQSLKAMHRFKAFAEGHGLSKR